MGTSSALKSLVLLPFCLSPACGSDSPVDSQPIQTGGAIATQTGGIPLGTGGVLPGTGGALSATGGVLPGTGGELATTGGQQAATGGEIAGTGGESMATGGESMATGGESMATGGELPGAAECESGEPEFSFFVTSLETMRVQSGSQDGFGGDFGGLAGADEICQTAAANVGCGSKVWRAFLSATDDGNGNQVNAIERIGSGPWYDARGWLISQNIEGLVDRGNSSGGGRPVGDANAVDDMANEFGEGLKTAFPADDDHDVITGSNRSGELDAPGDLAATCNDWTSTTVTPGEGGRGGTGLAEGHAWSARSGYNWIQVHHEPSCAAGVNLVQNGGGDGNSVGAGGGWGGIFCFALQP